MVEGPILIVEDDPVIRELLLDLLEIEGFTAIAVENGVEALRSVRQNEPALILLDLNLPLLDGEAVLRELQRTEVEVPVLLMTADPRGRLLSASRGISGFIPKPFDVDDLIVAIRMIWESFGRRSLG